MIKSRAPISMAEAQEYLQDEKSVEVKGFVKQFSKMKSEKAKELREALNGLDLMKIDDTRATKIIDLLPEDKEELNKIFSDISLEEDETTKILDTVKGFK